MNGAWGGKNTFIILGNHLRDYSKRYRLKKCQKSKFVMVKPPYGDGIDNQPVWRLAYDGVNILTAETRQGNMAENKN